MRTRHRSEMVTAGSGSMEGSGLSEEGVAGLLHSQEEKHFSHRQRGDGVPGSRTGVSKGAEDRTQDMWENLITTIAAADA